MSKAKLLLDTNVASRLSAKTRSPEDWRVLDKVRADFDVVISPMPSWRS
jgi:predicted nucleic acid-binding protein